MASLADLEKEVIGLTNAYRKLKKQAPDEKVHSLEQQVTELFGLVANLQRQITSLERIIIDLEDEKQKTRGPKVENGRNSSRWDAWRVKFGNLKDMDVGHCAETLGLSKGQIYAIKYGQSHKSVEMDSFDSDGTER